MFSFWCICQQCNLLTSQFTPEHCYLLISILLGRGCGVRRLGGRQTPTKHLPEGSAPSFLLTEPSNPEVSPYLNIGCGYNSETHRQRSKCPLSPWPLCFHSIEIANQPNQLEWLWAGWRQRWKGTYGWGMAQPLTRTQRRIESWE